MPYTKSIDHIASYPPVSALTSYLLSVQFINYFYQQLLSLFAVVDEKALSPYFDSYLTQIDETFNSVVLGNLDTYVTPYLPVVKSFSDLNPITFFAANVLAPVNTTAYKLTETYLPAASVEGKAVFKLAEVGGTEYEKTYKLVEEIISRVFYLVSSKASEVSSHVTVTYNKELDSLAENASTEVNNVRKHVSASYQTSVKVALDLNKNYIQPLKTQTQDYVVDVKSKADSLISEAKTGIASGVSTATKQAEDLTLSINGTSIPVN